MEKPKKRADRRWRSHCVWMRRLRRDWNEHGWNWTIRRWPIRGLTKEGQESEWSETTLCHCFYDPKEMARFKDTPNRWSFPRRDHTKYRTGRADDRPIQERRRDEPDERMLFLKSRRSRREGAKRVFRLQCRRCGYLMGKRLVPVEEHESWRAIWEESFRLWRRCPNCRP